MSRRTEQINSILREAIQEFIARGLNDPRVGGLVTITAVHVSEDLKNADVMVSVLPEEKQELSLHGLRSAATHIRRQVGDKVTLRQMPQLNFKLDKSLKKQIEVLRALAKAAESTPALPPEDPATDPGATSSSEGDDAAGGAGNNPPGSGEGAAWPRSRRAAQDGGPEQEKSA